MAGFISGRVFHKEENEPRTILFNIFWRKDIIFENKWWRFKQVTNTRRPQRPYDTLIVGHRLFSFIKEKSLSISSYMKDTKYL